MKNILSSILIVVLVMSSLIDISAQITIGSLNEPIQGALLDVKQEKGVDINSETVKTGGMLLPRVKLKDLKSLEPTVSESATDYADQKLLNVGLMVYNTTKNDTKSIYEGIYAWSGNEWQYMVSQASEFNLRVSPVSLIVESGYDGQDITSKSISVSWRPVGSNCTVEEKAILNGGVSIGNLPLSLIGGNATITIPKEDITPLSEADLKVNPFLEKQSTLSLIVSDGTETRTEKVNITQRHHTLIVRDMRKEVELGETYTVRLASNTDWVATSSDASAIQILTLAGGANILGADFKFKISDLTADEGKDVSITFTSPEGSFPSQSFVLRTYREYPNSYMITPGEVFQLPVAKAFNVADEVFGESLSGTFTAELVWQDKIGEDGKGLITNLSVPTNATKSSFITVTTNTGSMTDILSPSMDPSENVTITTPMMGNALVALKVDGVTKWSWHVWVTDYKPNDALDYDFKNGESDALDVTGGKVVSFYNTVKSTVLMDRDLGGVSGNIQSDLIKGMVYQWGRKDPMAGGIGNMLQGTKIRPIYDMAGVELLEQRFVTTTGTFTGLKKVLVETGVVNYLQKSIEDPLTMFIGVNDNAHDWYSYEIDVNDSYLWNTVDGDKTNYDPCPKGWRVPIGGGGTDAMYYSIPAVPNPDGTAEPKDRNVNNLYYDYTSVGLGYLLSNAIRVTVSGTWGRGVQSWHGSAIAAFAYGTMLGTTLANVSYPQGRTMTNTVRCSKHIKKND